MSPTADRDAASVQLPQVLASGAARFQRPILLLFGWWWLMGLGIQIGGVKLPTSWRWTDAAFLSLGAVSALVGLWRHVPFQNVVGASLMIGGLAVAVEAIGVRTGIPFGRFQYTDALGTRWFGTVPWAISSAWILVLLTCRGVAKVLLRRWRLTPDYGFWLLGVTSVLATGFDLVLEPYAFHDRAYWIWDPSYLESGWYGVPWTNSLGWFLSATLLQFAVFPWFVNKKPVDPPQDKSPILLWVLLHVFFLVPNLQQERWAAVALGVVFVLGLIGFRRSTAA